MSPGRGGRGATAARATAVAFVVLGVALRVFRLADADIWWDEGLAVWAVRQGLAESTRWTAGDVHPPLFFWCLWLWRHLVGEDPFALRLLVVYTGVVLVALAWPLGRRLGGPWAGALAVAAVATSRFVVWWSMELRMYALAAVAVMVAALATLRWLDRRRRRDLAVYAVAAAAALHTVYLTGVALAALNAVVAAAWLAGQEGARRTRAAGHPSDARRPNAAARPGGARGRAAPFGGRDAVAWAAAQLAVAAAVAPWLLYAAERMSSWRVVEAGPSLAFTGQLWLTLLATGISTDIDAVAAGAAVFAAALALAAALAPPARRRRAAPLALALLAVPTLGLWAITQPRSLFYSPRLEARYFVPFAAPLLAAAAALAVGAAGRGSQVAGRWSQGAERRSRVGGARFGRAASGVIATAGLAAALFVPSLWHLPGYFAPRRAADMLPAMALAIWSQAEPGDAVVLVSGNRYPLWLYHYDRAWAQPLGAPRLEFPPDAPPRWADRPPVVLFPDRGSDPLATHPDWADRLDGLADRHPRLWLVELGRSLQDPDDAVEAWLGDRLALVLSEGYGADALHLFARVDAPPRVTALSSRWPGTAVLSGAAAATAGEAPPRLFAARPARRAAPGDTLDATLFALPGATATGSCRLTVSATAAIVPATTAPARGPAPDGATGAPADDRPPDGPWTMSESAALDGRPPPRRVRATTTLPADAVAGPRRVTVEGCAGPWSPPWRLDVVAPPPTP